MKSTSKSYYVFVAKWVNLTLWDVFGAVSVASMAEAPLRALVSHGHLCVMMHL